MSAEIGFAPLLPPVVILLLAVLGLVPVAVSVWRRVPGGWWRLLALAAGIAFLAQPVRSVRTGTHLPAVAVVAVDRSASMAIGGRAGLAARALARLQAQAERDPGLQLRVVEAGARPDAQAGGGTRLFGTIDSTLAEIPPDRRAGVILLSDGAVDDAPARFAPRLNLLIPAAGEEVDRRLRITLAPGYGIVGQTVQIGLVAEDLGRAQGRTAQLSWSVDGVAAGSMALTTGVPAQIGVKIGRAGPISVALSLEGLAGEASALNNRAALTINGVRDRLRVLLISGEPHDGERSWRRLLKSDPSVDLVHFTILRPPGRDDMTPINELALIAFPVRELFVEKIRDFDLIILDRFSESGILPPSYVQNIADYVRQGGALLVSAGPEFADEGSLSNGPIGEILPAAPAAPGSVVEGAFRPLVTALGERHPVSAGLAGDVAGGTPGWGQWYRRVAVGAVHGDVLMADGTAPLLVLDHVEQGRVALLLSDQIWLWARGHEGGGPQGELLRRISHWLMKQPELEENRLEARVQDGVLRVTRASTKAGAPPPLQVTDPDGRQTSLGWTRTPAGDVAQMEAPVAGLWQVRAGAQTGFAAAAFADPAEYADLRATATRLAPVARGVHWLARREVDLGALDLDRRGAMQVLSVRRVALLPPWLALALVLVAALLAWWRESGGPRRWRRGS